MIRQDRPDNRDGGSHGEGDALVRGALIRGWCPDAWRPMMAGDGLLVRVRPPLARMTREQALALCDAAAAFGNGAIDLTNRAGLQIRGVGEANLPVLLERLVALGLVAANPAEEARPAIVVAPDWTPGDATDCMARELAARLSALPDLPGKTGFAVDLSGAPVLAATSADFRLEQDREGGLIVRADGRPMGVPVTEGRAIDTLLDLARWFATSGGPQAGRMARHRADLPPALTGTSAPAPPRSLSLGSTPTGCAYGAPFGRMAAEDLAALLMAGTAPALRITPWRHIILEGVEAVPAAGFILDPLDAAMRADACVGAPACPQAMAETRSLALRLAPHIDGSLHVSGCAKGCARPSPASLVLTAREAGFDLGFDARAGDPPSRSALSPQILLSLLGAS